MWSARLKPVHLALLSALGIFLFPLPMADARPAPLDPCYNGVFPLNPNVDNCALGPRPGRVLGSAPDATAIINCRGNLTCLSLYVNGGYGFYPGAVLVPGYHP